MAVRTVEEYIVSHLVWKDCIDLIREVMLECGLDESIKWGMPTFMFKQKNIASMGAFKEHITLWYHQGIFLTDELNLLSSDDKAKSMRHMKFQGIKDIDRDILKSYALEAMENQLAGKEVKIKQNKTFSIPKALQEALSAHSPFELAFNQLTWGKQKEYANYIAEAKQEKTVTRRLDKIKPLILKGRSLHEKYIKQNG